MAAGALRQVDGQQVRRPDRRADKRTGKPLKCRADAIWNCVVERMTGQPTDGAGRLRAAVGRRS
jgi:hypothetical protein